MIDGEPNNAKRGVEFENIEEVIEHNTRRNHVRVGDLGVFAKLYRLRANNGATDREISEYRAATRATRAVPGIAIDERNRNAHAHLAVPVPVNIGRRG